MTIDDKIRDEKLQYDINRAAAKISVLSSGKIDKYEYLTGEEMLPPQQLRIIQEAKFTYCALGKAFENETKKIDKHGEKQVEACSLCSQMSNKHKYINNEEIVWSHVFKKLAY